MKETEVVAFVQSVELKRGTLVGKPSVFLLVLVVDVLNNGLFMLKRVSPRPVCGLFVLPEAKPSRAALPVSKHVPLFCVSSNKSLKRKKS